MTAQSSKAVRLRGQVEGVLGELLQATRGSRATFRVDLPDMALGVDVPLAEVLAPGVRSMLGDASIDHRAAGTIRWLEEHRRTLVQDDIAASPIRPPEALGSIYGAKAQLLAPVIESGAMIGWVSVHFVAGAREWSTGDIAAIESAAARIGALLAARGA